MNIPRPLFPDSHWKSKQAAHRLALPLAGLIAIASIAPGAGLARGWIGVSVQDIDPSLREAMALPLTSGALVSDIVPNSPADRAGVCARDVIVRVGKTSVEESDDLIAALREMNPGDEIELSILRGGDQLMKRIVLAERPAREGSPEPMAAPREGRKDLPTLPDGARERRHLGVRVHPLDPHLARYFNVRPGKGLLVLSVASGSPADRAGVLPGDILLSFNGEQLSEPRDLRQGVLRLGSGDGWKSNAIREGKEREFRGRVEPSPQGRLRQRLLRPSIRFEMNREEGLISGRREIKRLEREMQRLRERVKLLETRIHGEFDR
jgi:S1-C subfamily serine protease